MQRSLKYTQDKLKGAKSFFFPQNSRFFPTFPQLFQLKVYILMIFFYKWEDKKDGTDNTKQTQNNTTPKQHKIKLF